MYVDIELIIVFIILKLLFPYAILIIILPHIL